MVTFLLLLNQLGILYMVFEYIVEPENKSKSLSKEEENHYAKKIVDLYKDLDDARKDIIKLAKELQRRNYF